MTIELTVPPYPALRWFGQYGAFVVWILMFGIMGGGAVVARASGQGWWLAVALVVGLMIGGLVRLLLDIVRLLVETLIPQ